MVIPSPTWSSQSAWSVMFLTLVSYEDVINGMKTKPVYSLLCSPVSTTIIDTAYYTNISSEVCGTNCQPLKGGNCYTYGDGLCGLLLSPSDVSLLYRNCYSDNATCGHETFSAMSRKESISLLFLCSTEKRARIVCYGSRHPSSTEVYPDIQHEVKHDGENDEPLWTSAGIAAIVAGLSAVAVTIGLVICATKRCVFFRPRKKLSLCLQHLTTLSTDTGVSQTGVSVEYQVDTSTTDTSVYVHHTH